ncbi:G-type lectin S-receptor-like serine/threonine-protein kinase LECRK4 [Papaver somniferum]|uniref:G-type lectin S-receptor-like serine/threonine-protein kinase LECRK4 n=1 Tax=Papaver somniferum TaxID=3469 RepID=UPI000E704999|nr:G-type lectin S-receptor-like serine/threonine-protein kinase LECRK4 [Papaver somniferum]
MWKPPSECIFQLENISKMRMSSFSIFVFLLFSAAFSIQEVTAQQRNSTISLNSTLSPNTNTSWLSSSGRFAFGFYQEGDGFALGIWLTTNPEKTVIWTANRDNPKVSSNVGLIFTSGGLILTPAQGENITISRHNKLASSASMQDTGNFVICDSGLKVIWQSFESPTDTLLPGQRLLPGMVMYSSASDADHSKGRFLLIMQTDAYLVQYPALAPYTITYGYWDSGPGSAGTNATLNLDNDGKLYLRNLTGIAKILSESKGNETMYRMTVDVDGFFRLYSHPFTRNENWTVVWAPDKYDNCGPKGLCGSNAYCTLMDQKASCLCLPGFLFVDPDQPTLGCERQVTIQSCGSSRKEEFADNMSTLEKTDWTEMEINTYSVATSANEDECREACRVDCNCEAAIFDDLKCRKQKIPLRFGRTALDASAKTTFIKVANSELTVESTEVPIKDRKKDVLIRVLVAIVSLVTFALATLGIFSFLLYKREAPTYNTISEQPSDTGLGMEMPLRSFTFEELEKATDNFKEVLGRGSFGTVSKGKLPNASQTIIAVKRIEPRMVNEGEKEFLAEMRAISRTHHRNLVQLLGYCHEGTNRLLVYEYMVNGSLADFLFKCKERPSWNVRVEIALSVARGILYLHEECKNQIIHCDIKPQNILMDQNNSPKIADFGLAKLLKQDQTKTFTAMRGTRGYIAPEWYRNFPITVKADVYSFGIVLMEIVCCRRALNMELAEDEIVLVDWVFQCLYGGKLDKLVTDDEEVDMRKFERMVIVALWSIQDEPSLRPSMKNVVLMLEGTIDIPNPPNPDSSAASPV